MLRYDEPALAAELDQLSPAARTAFAAACAERLLPAYRQYLEGGGSGDVGTVEGAIRTAWEAVSGPIGNVIEHEEAVDALQPDDDDPLEAGLAENALAAVVYALRVARSGTAQDAAWAARQVYEALDLWISTRDDVDFNVAGAEERVLGDPLIQEELARQRRLVDQLRMMSAEQLSADAASLRAAARSSSWPPAPD